MKELYAWVSWFGALTGKISEGGEKYLIEQEKQVKRRKDTPALLKYGDENIDPFSFFYFLAQKNTTKQREPVYKSVSEVFEVDSQISKCLLSDKNLEDGEDGFIFPTPTPNSLALFHDDKKSFNPNLLWHLFRQAIQLDVNINTDDFSGVLNIKSEGVEKLTQCLFLINPHYFMPVDKVSLAFHTERNLPSCKEAEKEIKKPNGWTYYKETILGGFRTADDIKELKTFALKNTHDERGKYHPVLELRNGKLKAQNYVGIIQTRRGPVLEILPKVDLGHYNDVQDQKTQADEQAKQDEATRQVFLKMLRTWRGIKHAQFNSSSICAAKI